MNNNIGKHDSQPAGSSNSSSDTTNSSRNVLSAEKQEICRNYLWGKCKMGNNCRLQHVFDIERIKNTVTFCHDYQNGKPCIKVPCNFIHTTEEEQALFFKTGKVPKALAERYANMTSAEKNPQMAKYNQESCPPPPLQTVAQPSTSSSIGPQQTYNMGQIPVMSMGSMLHPGIGMGTMHPVAMNMGPMLPPIMSMPGPSSMVAPPPPTPIHHLPPPPPPPTQSSTSSTQSTPPKYTAPPPPAVRLPLNQSPTSDSLKFDPRRPPPPLPNATSKRSSVNNDSEAGPSKMRKEAEPNNDDARCDLCQQRQIRIDVYDKDIEKMYARYELQNLIYKKKIEEVKRKEDILKRLLSPEVYKLIDECLEEGSQLQDPVNQNAIPSDRSLFAQMIKYIVSNDRTHSMSPRLEESLRTFMSRSNPNNTIQNASSLREFICDGNKKKEGQPAVNGTSKSSNDYSNHNVTHKEETPASYSQSSIASTSKTQTSQSGAKTAVTTASTSYFYYSMPPPISRPYNAMPQTALTAAAGTSMTYQQNGMPGPSQNVKKPSTSAPPPKSNNQSTQNSVPFPPQTPYYNPYQ